MEHLARYTGGDAALNAEILRLFDSQANDLVARLRSILDARDTKSWKEVTHTLKGAARGIGAFPMADAAADLEPIDLGDRETALSGIGVLDGRAADVAAFIRRYTA
ncbi:MAG TPA: Hpt domain-containing protein [Rhizomicrobium sp.]|jgi:HPt (histidine-containing phosphotransfer) domain-containing protein|nr:Hpt domain-containing protein [Rhizomicrobium sp.]